LDLLAEFEALVVALGDRDVPYAVCGGMAVNVHGHVRATMDIDVLAPRDGLEAILEVARNLGFGLRAGPIPFGADTPVYRELHRASKIDGEDVLTIDVLVVTPVLREAWDTREVLEWQGRPLPVVSRAGLIAMKKLAGRLQDLADIEKLEGSDA
jgi:hypothetical protein